MRDWRTLMNLLPLCAVAAGSKSATHWPVGFAGAGLLLAAFLCSYATTLAAMADRWATDPQYSHGFLVPIFTLVVLWSRRDLLASVTWQPSFWGLPLLVGGILLCIAAVTRDIEPLDAFSLLPTLFGLVLFVGGKACCAGPGRPSHFWRS